MDTLSAGIMGMLNRNREQMVFDWDRAAEIVKMASEFFKDDPDFSVEVALSGDEGNTWGTMYKDGKPNYDGQPAYLASTWARPKLTLNIDRESMKSHDDGYIELLYKFGLKYEDIGKPNNCYLEYEDAEDPSNCNLVAYCYKMQHEVPDWNTSTWWPESARAIFNS